MIKRAAYASTAVCLTAAVVFLMACTAGTPAAGEISIDMETYHDKTAGGVIGHVAGLLSGFEFIWNIDGTPMVPLPGEWFELLKGPYGGGNAYGGAGVSRMLENGIGSDDDYHIDFFNQHILSESGVLPSHFELMDQWRSHAVSDWGGGDKAMEIMRTRRLTPPYTGLREFGNIFHWCTEAYIENETLGLSAPGMPAAAGCLAQRFSAITGDFEPIDWALFWAVAYAQAYVETEAKAAMEVAYATLLENSHSRNVYDTCIELYESGVSWEEAVLSVEAMRREIYGCDNIQCVPDVNNGFAVLAILYSENDWLEAVRLASVCGYDADCTAATVGGLMGVIAGLNALPQEVLDVVWQDGDGIYVNDINFTPHIAQDYPTEQPFKDIVNLYVENGVAQALAAGGCLEDGILYLPVQSIGLRGIQIDDFEMGLEGWNIGKDADCVIDYNEAHTGDACMQIRLQSNDKSVSVSRAVKSLEPGSTYKLSAYVRTDFDGQARMEVDGISVSAYNANKGWVLRELYFTAKRKSVEITLTAAQMPADRGISVWFDNIRIERVSGGVPEWFAEDETFLEKRDSAEWEVDIPYGGDWALVIEYVSSQRTGQVTVQFAQDGETLHNAAFPGTGQQGQDGSGTCLIPVRAAEGRRSLSLTVTQGDMTVLRAGLAKWPEYFSP